MRSNTVASTYATNLGTARAVAALVIAILSVIRDASIGAKRLAGVIHNGHNRLAGLALFWSGEVGTIPESGREASRRPERAWLGRIYQIAMDGSRTDPSEQVLHA